MFSHSYGSDYLQLFGFHLFTNVPYVVVVVVVVVVVAGVVVVVVVVVVVDVVVVVVVCFLLSRTVPYHSLSFSMVLTLDIASFVVEVFQIYKRTYAYLRWRGHFIYRSCHL